MPNPALAFTRTPARMNRNTSIVIGVVLLHVGALWALQTGLLRRVAELVVPAEILVEIMTPSPPVAMPAATPPKAPTPAKPAPVMPAPVKAPVPVAAPTPLAVADPAPAPSSIAPAAAAATTSAPVNSGAISTAGVSTPASTGTATAATKVELPSTDADYLNNPKPPYPRLSKQLGEQGKVVVRTLIGVDGTAQKAEIKQSSGFDRLDQAALATALRWRYVPGKRAGVPEAMWFNVPFSFVLE
jgi:protein TonB